MKPLIRKNITQLLGTKKSCATSRQKEKKKFLLLETKHLSTDADSSTDAVGWTKNTQKPDFFLKNGKNHPKLKRDMPKLEICPLTRGL